jgi:hypothetical protein
MAEVVGVDHVSIGTDQFDSRGCVEDYTRRVHLVAAMLRGGFTPGRPARSPAATTCASSVPRLADGFRRGSGRCQQDPPSPLRGGAAQPVGHAQFNPHSPDDAAILSVLAAALS